DRRALGTGRREGHRRQSRRRPPAPAGGSVHRGVVGFCERGRGLVAGPVDAIMQRAEELLRGAGGAIDRVAEELPQVAALLRSEPRLRAALTDIAVGTRAKQELLRSLFGERVDPATLGVLGLLVEELLSPEELERAASDLV